MDDDLRELVRGFDRGQKPRYRDPGLIPLVLATLVAAGLGYLIYHVA